MRSKLRRVQSPHAISGVSAMYQRLSNGRRSQFINVAIVACFLSGITADGRMHALTRTFNLISLNGCAVSQMCRLIFAFGENCDNLWVVFNLECLVVFGETEFCAWV